MLEEPCRVKVIAPSKLSFFVKKIRGYQWSEILHYLLLDILGVGKNPKSCGFLRIFTYTDDGLFKVRLVRD